MPSSPRTPTRVENRISIDSSPYGYSNGHARSPHSRKSSLCSPSTPGPQSAHATNGIPTMLNDFAGAMDGGNDLGSLADELAEVWDEDAEGDEEVLGLPTDDQCGYTPSGTPQAHHQANGVSSSPAHERTAGGFTSPKKGAEHFKARRRRRDHDGSDCGDDSDLDQTPFSVALEVRMATIQELGRLETEERGGDTDGVVERVVNGLRELGAQSSVETGTTRSVLTISGGPEKSPV